MMAQWGQGTRIVDENYQNIIQYGLCDFECPFWKRAFEQNHSIFTTLSFARIVGDLKAYDVSTTVDILPLGRPLHPNVSFHFFLCQLCRWLFGMWLHSKRAIEWICESFNCYILMIERMAVCGCACV